MNTKNETPSKVNLLEIIKGLNDNSFSTVEVHTLISRNPELFKFVKNPTHELELLAVRMLGSNIRYVKDQTPLLQQLAVIDDIENIKYIENPIQQIEERAISELPEIISYLKNPSDFSVLVACRHPDLFKYIKNPSPYICDYAVKKNPENIAYIKNPSLDLQRIAYQADPKLLTLVENVDAGLLMEIIPTNPYIVTELKNVTDVQYKMAIRQEPTVLLHLDDRNLAKYRQFATNVVLETVDSVPENITEDMVRDCPITVLAVEYSRNFHTLLDIAIREEPLLAKLFVTALSKEQISYLLANNGWLIQYLNKTDDNMLFLAVSNNQDYCIQYIYNPPEYLQRFVIEEQSSNIQYISNPTEEIINLAITKSPFNIQYIKNPSEFILYKAVRKNPNCIKFVENQEEKLHYTAYKQNELSANFFKNMSTAIKLMVLSDHPEFIENDEYKLSIDELMQVKIEDSIHILLHSDKDLVLEYLDRIKETK